jgi:hypothetical protein
MRKGIKEPRPEQASKKGQPERKDRVKNTCTVSARMRQVVDQMLACDEEAYTAALHQTTVFAFRSQQSEIISSFLQDMSRENCALYQNKELLLRTVGEAYDEAAALVHG